MARIVVEDRVVEQLRDYLLRRARVPGETWPVIDAAVLDWLLAGDPAIRWQVMADLLDADDESVSAERARVATEGWGARLLAEQDPDGLWDGGLYTPKWTSTTYTLLLLHWLGLSPGHPQARRGCDRLWEWAAGFRRGHMCILGMLTMIGSSHGAAIDLVDEIVTQVLDRQLDDGGWNCSAAPGRPDTHSSFHTAIICLEALHLYVVAGGRLEVATAMDRCRLFFLEHRLYRSHRTGEVAIAASTRFPFPPQWHFDVMRGLEHFAAAVAERDPRLGDAVELVRSRRRSDGTWPTYRGYPGRQWLIMEEGRASRWNTLRALRVLRWWEGPPGPGGAPPE